MYSILTDCKPTQEDRGTPDEERKTPQAAQQQTAKD